MRSPGVGAWRGARSLGCGSAIAEIAGCAQQVDADGRPMPDDGAHTRRRHKGYRLINTNISLHSIRRPFWSADLGYSVSVVQGVVLTEWGADHHKQLACGLRASRPEVSTCQRGCGWRVD